MVRIGIAEKQYDIGTRFLECLEELVLYGLTKAVGIVDYADEIPAVSSHVEPAAESIRILCPVAGLSAHLHADYVHG